MSPAPSRARAARSARRCAKSSTDASGASTSRSSRASGRSASARTSAGWCSVPDDLPQRVGLREVGPRDGFQNEPEVIATDEKVRLVDMLARTGLRRLEVTSFVRADVIPQLADAAEVLGAVDIPDEVSVSVLIPNERGLDNALALRERFQEVNCFLSASETHNQRNVNRSIEDSLAGLERVLGRARAEGLRCEG